MRRNALVKSCVAEPEVRFGFLLPDSWLCLGRALLVESCPRCCMPSGFPRSRVPDGIADFLSSSPLQVFHLHAVWRCAIQVFSPSSMADIPATEHLAMGLGRHGRHQAMTQVMGAMPIEDLLEKLQEQKKAMLVTCLVWEGLWQRKQDLESG